MIFFNGGSNRPEKEILKLSDSYMHPMDTPELELICTVYNINPGQNPTIMEKSKVLSDYTAFVEKIREYEAEKYEDAISRAIDYCLEHDILTELLSTRRDEVLKAMTIDMTWERREQLIRDEEREEGHQEGLSEGLSIGIDKGRQEGLSIGHNEGIKYGLIEAYISSAISKEYVMDKLGITSDEELNDLIKEISSIKQI